MSAIVSEWLYCGILRLFASCQLVFFRTFCSRVEFSHRIFAWTKFARFKRTSITRKRDAKTRRKLRPSKILSVLKLTYIRDNAETLAHEARHTCQDCADFLAALLAGELERRIDSR
jgi:hypothetical protein